MPMEIEYKLNSKQLKFYKTKGYLVCNDIFSSQVISPLYSNAQHEHRGKKNGIHHEAALFEGGKQFPRSICVHSKGRIDQTGIPPSQQA